MKRKNRLYFVLKMISLLILFSSILSAQSIKINDLSHFSTSPLIINEIMFKPNTSAGNKEWIEIFNRSENPISLINFQICDATYNWKNIVSDKVIDPEEYIVLARTTDTLTIQNYYETQIEFAGTDGWSSLNNDGDIVLLADNNNVILDSMSYSASGSYPNDISLERENPFDDEEIVWDACIDSSGATPGTTNSISPFEYDIQAYEIIIEEQDESSLSITGYCENVGFNSLSDCQCALFVDNNFNKQLDEGEKIYEETFSISSGEIDTFIVNFEIPEENYYLFGFLLENEYDMNAHNNQVFATYNSPQNYPMPVNEIQYAPKGDEPEWLELYNNFSYPIDISGWKLADKGDTLNLTSAIPICEPGKYFILVEDDNDTLFILQKYFTIGPTITPKFIIGLPSLNNDEDLLLLFDEYSTVLDSIYYFSDWGKTHGNSLERIKPNMNSNNPDNWGVSIDSCGATPGRVNSITPKDYDLCALSLTKELNENILTLSGICTNVGFNDIEDAEAIFFNDINFNSHLDDGEEIATQNFSISAEQSEEFSYPKEINEKNYYHFGFLIFSNFDLDTSNNIIFTTYNSPQNYPMPVNEIQYAPKGDEPEWLELYNNFSYLIDISGWKLADKRDTLSLWSAKPIFLPEEYIIIVKDCADTLQILQKYSLIDSAFSTRFAVGLPSLNNDEDMLLLWDEYGTVIDSIYYFSDWGEISGNSLERINPNINSNNSDNWESSIQSCGATPGRENSLHIEEVNPHIKLSINPNPVSLRVKKSVLIEYNLPEVLSKVNMRIFDMKGRLIRWLSDQQWIGSQGAIIWNCKDDNGRVVPIGIYIVYLEATGKQSGKIFQKTKTMVIGEK